MGKHVDGFPDRDGMDKLINVAKALCVTINTFAPLLLKKFPDSPLIPLLITAIQGVCALIPELENEFSEVTWDNSVPSDTPEATVGINPDAEQSYPPDYTP